MKEIKIKKKKSILKKLLIKLNRFFGFEIIDQSNCSIPSIGKFGYENLSKENIHLITLPLGKLEIKRPVKSLHIIFRSCASVKILSQSKEKVFNKEKHEYSTRTLFSLVESLNYSKKIFDKFKSNIESINQQNKTVTENQKSNMANIN